MKRITKVFFIILLLGVILTCSIIIYLKTQENKKEQQVFEELIVVIESTDSQEDDKRKKYEELYNMNNDFIGWISIEGTNISYPVMQTKDRPEYYLRRNFYKEYSNYGTPFIAENCDIDTSDNIIIYGHHMKGFQIFGELEKYKTKEFCDSHKIIEFDTLKENAKYEIIAVFKTALYTNTSFRYYEFTKANNEEEYINYISKCKQISFYDIEATAFYNEKLITLSTCEYSNKNGRLVVVARKVEN